MKDTLLYILSSIVEKQDEIKIEESENDGVVEFAVIVPKEEMGKVIGKKGRVIASIRNVMKIKALRHNKKVMISLHDPAE